MLASSSGGGLIKVIEAKTLSVNYVIAQIF